MLKPLHIILISLGVLVLGGFFIYRFVSVPKHNSLNLSLSPVSSSVLQSPGKSQDLTVASTSSNNVTSSIGTLATAATSIPKNTVSIPLAMTKLSPKTPPANPSVALTGHPEIMAWIYPGGQSCGAKTEYSDGRKIDVLKAEYYTINDSGQLVQITENKGACNGYSAANVASLKKYSKEQYATVSSSYSVSMDTFLTAALKDNTDINTLVNFVVANNMTGIELDFEDFGGWTGPIYSNYKQFVTELGNALHGKNKKLIVDGPATSNAVEESWYVWRYADFNTLPVDRLVVMTYDYQYDQGPGQPVAPIAWLQNTIKWTLGRFPNKAKLSIGIPSYGYKGTIGTQKFSLLTYSQIKNEPGFSTAQRDPASFEMTWQNGNNVYFYQDGVSMTKKLQAIQSAGINSVSVWHLGGNLWFK